MPVHRCFSYSADVPLGIGSRNAAQRAVNSLPRMPRGSPCFSYSADGPLGDLSRMPAAVCFTYSPDGPLGNLPRMPATSHCFRY